MPTAQLQPASPSKHEPIVSIPQRLDFRLGRLSWLAGAPAVSRDMVLLWLPANAMVVAIALRIGLKKP